MLTSSSPASSSSSLFSGLLADAEAKLSAVTEEMFWAGEDQSIVFVAICDVTGQPDFFQTLNSGKVLHEQINPERFLAGDAVPAGFVAFTKPQFLDGLRESMALKVECIKRRAA